MKKIYFPVIAFVFFAFMASGLVSCKKGGFFTPTSTTNLDENTIFRDSLNTTAFLANIYSNVGLSFKYDRFIFDPFGKAIPTGGLESASDEAESPNQNSSTALAFATGTINSYSVTDDAYRIPYNNIRAVNQLFRSIVKTPIDQSLKDQMIAEAHFLRAWYYFILLKHYGGVPIVGDTLYNYTDEINTQRATFEQTVDYIISECNIAEKTLPLTQTGSYFGRASGSACKALRSRVLLYAASPLFNPDPSVNANFPWKNADATVRESIAYANYSASRWAAAKNAAAEIIQAGTFSLNEDNASDPGKGFRDLFPKRTGNPEYIFPWMFGDNTYVENLFYPPSRFGANGAYPYQGLVDAFLMSNGLPIDDPASGYNAADPYANRDPRLNYSIIHDQTLVNVRTVNGLAQDPTPIDIYVLPNGIGAGQDAFPTGTRTGYYNRKMYDPTAVPATLFYNSKRVIPLMRYAEILLNFAEAKNEFDGPGGTTDSVYSCIKAIRKRAGISAGADQLYGLKPGMTKEQMRKVIQNERRIELAFEEQRFWDVRRWGIAEQTENITAQGMKVTRDSDTDTTPTYEVVNIKRHTFRAPAMYLWPLPQNEVDKSDKLKQNPGY
ncbi:RagB/SusD family nutrient uptake outer membrane protein [Mucilaginibacter limnophilus]|uniref:RagB/SusD family nutrient uptake outer membrane protein n=1 Tax=Mucilaginibacter limnophilus TaxID=1932778 RepID=A0A437MYD7_9SPHI|nr:RagB/SusD family nutrient uptake outer membrane protein [Mucilaginibacter limnophilus]RVU02606.1 RagB/SusD family nutrient uptake outer membrane protein [Mucilaginibacter limnophilus]